jgi:flagellar assembly factor FliW
MTLEKEQDRTNIVDFPRFGECSYLDSEVIEFPWGLPGFGHLRNFVVLQVAGQEGFIWLQSLDDVNTALPLADPWSIFADYDPHLPQYAKVALALDKPEEFIILCVVVVTKNAAEMTMNLMAPVVINLKTRIGRQVMLEAGDYSVRTPLPRLSSAPLDDRGASGDSNDESEVISP